MTVSQDAFLWDSIEEDNDLKNLLSIQAGFSCLIMTTLCVIWKRTIPEWQYIIATRPKKESKPTIDTVKNVDIENPLPAQGNY